jgi:hypothetical protein
MCMQQNASGCGCHCECGCDGSTEEQIRALELTRESLLLRVRCLERNIGKLKEPGRKSRSK